MNSHSGTGGGRAPGQWKDEVRMRQHKAREPIPNQSNKCIPKITDVGSAAYRRLMAAKERGR